MKIKNNIIIKFILIILICAFVIVLSVNGKSPIIHTVLFYSPTCSHCHKVITEDLSVLKEEYRDQLLIFGIDIQTEVGNQLFISTLDYFGIPYENAGVPLLVVGEGYLFGSLDIPEKLPGIIIDGLENGGINWPRIPLLEEVLRSEGLFADEDIGQSQEMEIIIDPEKLSALDLFQQDPVGNSISGLVIIGMLIIFIRSVVILKGTKKEVTPWSKAAFLLFLIIGLIVAIYMSYIEMSHTEALCGPVGDCNAVQQSPYAYLFGIIPIGAIGLLGYCSIGLIWLAANYGLEIYQLNYYLILMILTAIGTIFSIYLTIVEIFVIGATCIWCLTSAIVITGLLWQATISYMEQKKKLIVIN